MDNQEEEIRRGRSAMGFCDSSSAFLDCQLFHDLGAPVNPPICYRNRIY
jgi:hypothetical protein